MTKDSICKECRWQKHIVCQSEEMESLCATQELTSCKQMVNGDMSDEVRVLECSEFEKKIKKEFDPFAEARNLKEEIKK